MKNLDKLKEITHVLADEIHNQDKGPTWDLITLLLDNIETPIGILSSDRTLLYYNSSTQELFNRFDKNLEDYLNKPCGDLGVCQAEFCDRCPAKEVLQTRQVASTEVVGGITGFHYRMTCIPLIYNGISGIIMILGIKD